MKIRAAVLDRMGAAVPYAVSRPLRIAAVELDGPGRGAGHAPVQRGLPMNPLDYAKAVTEFWTAQGQALMAAQQQAGQAVWRPECRP